MANNSNMDDGDGGAGRLVVVGRAVIDTRAPFRSVKEAVMLFGERVLVGEIYANKIKEMRATRTETEHSQTKVGALTVELDGTRQTLEKAKEENNLLAYCIQSLTNELDKTKKELHELKQTDQYQKPQQLVMNPEIEDIKFVENEKEISTQNFQEEDQTEITTLHKKRYVKFASPPELDRIIVSKSPDGESLPGKSVPSVRKLKKKTLIPLVGWLFSKKRNQEGR